MNEHDLLAHTVRKTLERICPPAVVRAAWSEPFSRARWGELAAAGVMALLIPVELGGLGLSEAELAVALEEAGRAAFPGPLVETAAVAAPLLAGSELAERWLPAIAAGEAVVAVGHPGQPVLDAADADLVILDGIAYPREAVSLTPLVSVDGARHLAQAAPAGPGVALDGAQATPRGALGASSFLIGLARRMLAITVEYVKVRHQFGRPVGSFQAVKHHLANAACKIELAAPVVRRAAEAAALRQASWRERASMAKAAASDAASFVARVALQCHGAIGYAFEHDLHLWMKRTWAMSASWGDAAWHRARLAEAVLDRAFEVEDLDA